MHGIGPRIYTAAIAGSPEYVGTAHQDDRMDAMDIFRQECGPEDDLPSPAHALIAGYEVYHNQNYGSTRLYGYKDAAERVAKETGGKCRTLYTAPPPARIAEPESVSAPTTSADIGKLCAAIITDVCELPDRTSPEDKPDHLIITATELEKIIRKAFAREWIEKKNG
jgi:hypothetical protein